MAVIKSASDALMQQRHILSLMGIRQWGQLSTPVVQVRSLVDRFAEDDKHIKSMQNEIQEVQAEPNSVLIPPAKPVVVDDEMCIKSVVKEPSKLINNTHQSINSAQNTPSNIIDEVSTAQSADLSSTAISYVLEGIRVGEWVLLADISLIGDEEKLVWASLKTALSKWASERKAFFSVESIRYPMNDDLGNSPTLAQKCLDGFILRLRMMGDITKFDQIKLAFLSELSDGVDYFGEVQILPQLLEMHQDANAKKQLWQTVTV